MDVLLKLIGLWGLGDAVWLAVNPQGWSRFWGRWIARAGEGGSLRWALAGAEGLISLALVLRRWR